MTTKSCHSAPLHVAFCCSGNSGLIFLAAAARSLFESHSRPTRLRIHIVFEHLAQSEIDRLYESWEPWSSNGQVHFYRMSDYLGEKALDSRYGYWFRTWLHRVLPDQIDRVLYLDNDLIVMRDVSELWSVDIEEHLGAMVEDPGASTVKVGLAELAKSAGVEYDPKARYFNTGVMLINLKAWRSMDLGTELDQRFAAWRPHDHYFDQGEINLLYSDQFRCLPERWNFIHHPSFDFIHEQKSSVIEAGILHFAGPNKVTERWRREGEKSAFYGFLDRTAWKGWRSTEDQTFFGRLAAQLLEYRYLVNNRASIPGYRRRLLALVCHNPALLVIPSLIPFVRKAREFLARWRRKSCRSNT